MKKATKYPLVFLLSAMLLLAALSACGEKAKSAEPADMSAPAQTAEPADMSSPTQAAEPDPVPPGAYTATKMISRGEAMDIEPMHLTVNEDGSGVLSDNNGSYSVTFYFDEGTGIITELQSYFTFTWDGDSLVLIDGRDTETVFEPDA